MRLRLVSVLSLGFITAACAWVKPSTDSQKVVLATSGEVTQCAKKGETTSKTLGKFLFVPRGQEKIFTELVTLAKNEAVIMGGDTVVAGKELARGEQIFAIYQCRGA